MIWFFFWGGGAWFIIVHIWNKLFSIILIKKYFVRVIIIDQTQFKNPTLNTSIPSTHDDQFMSYVVVTPADQTTTSVYMQIVN